MKRNYAHIGVLMKIDHVQHRALLAPFRVRTNSSLSQSVFLLLLFLPSTSYQYCFDHVSKLNKIKFFVTPYIFIIIYRVVIFLLFT